MPVDIDVVRKRITEIRWTIGELHRLTSKDLGVDEGYAIRYNIIVLVESLVSLCLHIVSEGFGLRPLSYREAVRLAGERMGVACVRDLESLVGLRNLLVHCYWEVDDEKIYQSLRTNFKCVEMLLARVEEAFGG